ncbi:tripartite tricarboxylate transporter TctB family protein [Chloroflexota bacterium]
MKVKPRVIAALVVMAFFGYAFVSSWSFPTGVRLYAWSACIWGAIMGISYLVVQFLRKQKGSAEKQERSMEAFGSMDKLNYRRLVMWFGSLAAVIVTTWLFGFGVAALLFVFSYMKLNSRDWFESVVVTASIALVLWGLMGKVLMVRWIEGVVPRWLGF